MLLPSKHAGTRNDHRHRDRASLHANDNGQGAAADEKPGTWDRDTEAATALRNYANDFLAEEEISARRGE